MWDVEKIRQDFPILEQTIQGHPLIYLDNAATTQKPRTTTGCEKYFYETINASVHRGIHTLAAQTTLSYEKARETIQHYIHAASEKECIFVRGTTEGINLVAQSFGDYALKENDEILITQMEHHSNIVPWQMIAKRYGAHIKAIPISEKGELILDNLDDLLTEKTKIIACTYVSNTLGTVNPIKKIIKLAKQKQIPVLIDAAQAMAHMPINVQDLDCDFLVFSGHKMFGPTGVGMLYAKSPWLDKLSPYQGGGSMIETVTIENSTYAPPPAKFEAGSPPAAQAICLGITIEYLKKLDWQAIQAYEHELLEYATEKLNAIEGLRIIGEAEDKTCVLSFTLEHIHPHDIATLLDEQGIAIRAGHHCTMPLMSFYQIPATARASFCFYNTKAEVDSLCDALSSVRTLFEKKKT